MLYSHHLYVHLHTLHPGEVFNTVRISSNLYFLLNSILTLTACETKTGILTDVDVILIFI